MMVFRAGAGMNRVLLGFAGSPMRVPRRRGDEPGIQDPPTGAVRCSPQARG